MMLVLATFIAGCQPGLTLVPAPTASVLTIRVTDTLNPLRPSFAACAADENIGLVVLPDPGSEKSPSQLNLRLGPAKEQAYAAVIGEEDLALIVNPANSTSQIPLPTVQALFQGKQIDNADRQYQVWAYLPGSDAQEVVESLFRVGTLPTTLHLAPNPEALRKAVSSDPDAIGFIPQIWVDESVKAITVGGLKTERLKAPILALSAAEPEGYTRNWLLCLQERLAEEKDHGN